VHVLVLKNVSTLIFFCGAGDGKHHGVKHQKTKVTMKIQARLSCFTVLAHKHILMLQLYMNIYDQATSRPPGNQIQTDVNPTGDRAAINAAMPLPRRVLPLPAFFTSNPTFIPASFYGCSNDMIRVSV